MFICGLQQLHKSLFLIPKRPNWNTACSFGLEGNRQWLLQNKLLVIEKWWKFSHWSCLGFFATKMEATNKQSCPERNITTSQYLRNSERQRFWFNTTFGKVTTTIRLLTVDSDNNMWTYLLALLSCQTAEAAQTSRATVQPHLNAMPWSTSACPLPEACKSAITRKIPGFIQKLHKPHAWFLRSPCPCQVLKGKWAFFNHLHKHMVLVILF